MGHSFEMVWIEARSIATEVVDLQAIRDRAYEQLIPETMNQEPLALEANRPVPVNVGSRPEPAALLVGFAALHRRSNTLLNGHDPHPS